MCIYKTASFFLRFYLSFMGDFEKTEGKVFQLLSKLLQAGCLEKTDYVMGKYGSGVV